MYRDQSHSCVSRAVWGLHTEVRRCFCTLVRGGWRVWGGWRRHRIKSRTGKESLVFFLLLSRVSLAACCPGSWIQDETVSEPVSTGSVLLIGEEGVGTRGWGEGRTHWLLAQGSARYFLPRKMSNDWDRAPEEVERWKNKEAQRNEGISEGSLGAFFFSLLFFLFSFLFFFPLPSYDLQRLEWQRHANAAVPQVWERVDARLWVNVNDERSENTSRCHPLHTQRSESASEAVPRLSPGVCMPVRAPARSGTRV